MGDYNGRIIIVQHGGGGARGMAWVNQNPEAVTGGTFRHLLGTEESWENVRRIDMSICLACEGGAGANDNFANQLARSLGEGDLGEHLANANAVVRASEKSVSPLGTLWHSGTIRAVGEYPNTSQFFSYFVYGLHRIDSIERAGGRSSWHRIPIEALE